jgi:uncharacterized protein
VTPIFISPSGPLLAGLATPTPFRIIWSCAPNHPKEPMFIDRALSHQLIELSNQFSVLTILGPRQAGKTELSKRIFPRHQYVNLEDIEIRNLAQSDPVAFFKKYDSNVILDEIQRAPHLLSSIQVMVDQQKIKGRYILTGSHQTELAGAVSQSLAGRTVILQLLPLSIDELVAHTAIAGYEDLILGGFMPQIRAEKNIRTDVYYRSYLQTYVERDIRQMINVKDLIKFETFLRLCAGRVGNLVNASLLASDVGADTKTIQHWISILEASYIIKRLPPYFENIGKRLVKTPKLYFVEVGLASYLLGLKTIEQVRTHPLRGALFENLIVMDLIKHQENQALDPELYFYRDQNKVEVDVIYRRGNELIPIEIKSSDTFHQSFADNIKKFQSYADRSGIGVIIYGGRLEHSSKTYRALNFQNCSKAMQPF